MLHRNVCHRLKNSDSKTITVVIHHEVTLLHHESFLLKWVSRHCFSMCHWKTLIRAINMFWRQTIPVDWTIWNWFSSGPGSWSPSLMIEMNWTSSVSSEWLIISLRVLLCSVNNRLRSGAGHGNSWDAEASAVGGFCWLYRSRSAHIDSHVVSRKFVYQTPVTVTEARCFLWLRLPDQLIMKLKINL